MKPGNTIKITLLFSLLLLFAAISFAQNEIPGRPDPPRLVNDFAHILSAEQLQSLESKLVAFNDSTTVQIAVVIVPTLGGYEKADYAQQLGQKWGVGGSKFDNGFVVLVKPKTASEAGQVFIATGYGVEKFVPDATASDIYNDIMIPHFKEDDYYGGINAAVDALMGCVKGEYKADKKSKSKQGSPVAFIIIIIIIVIFLISRNNNDHHTINRTGAGGLLFFPWMMGGGGGSGSSGGFGGGGGGFGGFGGGSFGGGGAGGSW
ncbi:MAG: TPM domain-containing protein [Bacteroidota bacterium]